jgi:hypothetical protein
VAQIKQAALEHCRVLMDGWRREAAGAQASARA